NLEPKPEIAKDYVSHQVFWERTKFQDPYTKDDREEFKKCDHECPDEEHYKIDKDSRQKPIKSYCTQKIFHSSLDPNSTPPNGIGYTSIDGHHFTCDNPTTSFHIIFVVDKSSSMSGRDCRPEFDDTKLECLKEHNNRLGSVYAAVYKFITKRNNFRKTRDVDTNSLILFDHSALVAYENESLSNPDALLEKMIKYKPTG
ncbi:7131_t:CDS:2, partial [Diversispora eburnea]